MTILWGELFVLLI